MRRLLFDLEGNGLLPEITKVHCLGTADVDTGERSIFGPNEIENALEQLASADVLIAHNGLRYDFPVLEKLYGFQVPLEKKRDTLVIARLKYPDIKDSDSKLNAARIKAGQPPLGELFGSHSLRAWGERLRIAKGDFEGPWDAWSQAMQDYCVQDVETTVCLWKYLNPDHYSLQAIELEHRVAVLCDKIEAFGWPFNMEKAGALHARLIDEKARIETDLKEQFGGWYQSKGEFTPKRDNKKLGYVQDAPLTKIEWVTFNPNSRQHVERCLRKLGWQPKEFTDTGQAKLDETVIEGLADSFPQSGGLATYLMLGKRLGQLAEGAQAWLTNVQADGRIHAQYNPMGAVTSRAAHFRPNIAQVPALASPYGKECRELFCVPPGWEQVGADMSGLELRCLAHYMAKYDEGAYGKVILEGDVHWMNVLAMGLIETCPRDKHNDLHTMLREQGAKRFLYAWLYGAGDAKAGSIILEACRLVKNANPEWAYVYEKFFGSDPAPGEKKLRAVGKQAKEEFLRKTPGLSKLVWTVKELAEDTGVLPGLDRRVLPIRSAHAALNTLLQSAGAILCKQWICDSYDALIAEGLKWGWDGDFGFLAWVHDELQVACRNGLGDRVGAVLTRCAQQAGQPFNFRIRLDSEYKIGNDWSGTH